MRASGGKLGLCDGQWGLNKWGLCEVVMASWGKFGLCGANGGELLPCDGQ